ncbi:hypothetical protein HQ576_21045 [bacterium]|nr:hypothetical protein [bacterium]
MFVGGRVLLPGYDTYYHMRRIQGAVEHFPHVPSFDAFVNYPSGARIYWPEGFALPLAALAKAAGATPWSAEVERVCAWAIPGLGLAVVLATFWLGKVWLGTGVGLLAAAGVAVSPIACSASSVGRVDHDVAVVLGATLAFALCLSALVATRRWARASCAALAGVFLGLNLWVWPAAIVFVLVAAAFLFVRAAHAGWFGRLDTYAWDVPILWMVSSAVTITIVCTTSGASVGARASYVFLSALHVALAWACVAGIVAQRAILRATRTRRKSGLAIALATQVLLFTVACLCVPGFWEELRGSVSYVRGQSDFIVATATETRGLFQLGLQGAANALSWAVVLLPLVFLVTLVLALRSSARPGHWLIVLWTAATLILSLDQERFASFLAVPFAVGLGGLVRIVWAASARLQARHLLRGLVLATVLASVASPFERWQRRPTPPVWELRAVLPALDWLRTHTPAANPHDFATRPPYAVMAFWHYGHWLTYLAERANISCPFCPTEANRRGLEASQAFLLATTEAQAARLCRSLGVRYVFSTDLPVAMLAAGIGGAGHDVYDAPIMAAALQHPNGPRAPDSRGPLRYFRLVKEFPARAPWGLPLRTRIFELTGDTVPTPPSPAATPRPPHPARKD